MNILGSLVTAALGPGIGMLDSLEGGSGSGSVAAGLLGGSLGQSLLGSFLGGASADAAGSDGLGILGSIAGLLA